VLRDKFKRLYDLSHNQWVELALKVVGMGGGADGGVQSLVV